MVFVYIPGGRAITGNGETFHQTWKQVKRFLSVLITSSVALVGIGFWALTPLASTTRSGGSSSAGTAARDDSNYDDDNSFALFVPAILNGMVFPLLIVAMGAHPASTGGSGGAGSTDGIYICYRRLSYFCGLSMLLSAVFAVIMISIANECADDDNDDVEKNEDCAAQGIPLFVGAGVCGASLVPSWWVFPSDPEKEDDIQRIVRQRRVYIPGGVRSIPVARIVTNSNRKDDVNNKGAYEPVQSEVAMTGQTANKEDDDAGGDIV